MSVRSKKEVKPKIGRPAKTGAKPRLVKLTDEVAEYYRKLGGGNLTLGIERAAKVS